MSKNLERSNNSEIEYIDELTERVDSLEEKALTAARDRWRVVGNASVKIGMGGYCLADIAFANLKFFSDRPDDVVVGLGLGMALVAWGLRDAGEIPERFRRAKDLMTDTRMLRSSLTSRLSSAIDSIPFKRLL